MSTAKIRLRQAAGDMLFRIAGRPAAAPGTLTILMYHAVTAQPIDDPGQMSVSAARFERQMLELANAGVDIVDLADGVAAAVSGTLSLPAAAIVFDDGFVGVHDRAADVLRRRGWPATVFVTTSWIGAPAMPLAEARLGRPLTWSEVETLRNAGFAIGSHTHTHPLLSRLGEPEIHDELRRSRDAIAERLDQWPDTFAYPFGAFGSFDGRTRRALADEGFRVACTTVFGSNGRRADPLALRRQRVSWCDGDGEIAKLLAGCYDWYRWVQRAQTARLGPKTGTE